MRFFKSTAAKVITLATVGLLTALGISSYYESKKAKQIPLAFSEISQATDEAGDQGRDMGPVQKYLMGVNDCLMKIFESYNDSNGGELNDFAKELRWRMDPNKKIYRNNLADFLEMLPELAKNAKAEMSEFAEVRNELGQVSGTLSSTWDYDFHHNYHTEWYTDTETYTDSDGNTQTRTVTKTREVYDDTDHSYTYHRSNGEKASELLDALIEGYLNLRLKEDMRIASKTNPEGERAAKDSRPKEDDGPELNNIELLEIAATWHTGSTVIENLPTIYSNMSGLANNTELWRTEKNSSRSVESNSRYKTDPNPPRGYTIVENALRQSQTMSKAINEILGSMNSTESQIPTLKEKIDKYIALENATGEEIDRKELRNDIMEISRNLYNQNFKQGVDVDGFRIWLVTLIALGGALGGGLAGIGVEKLAQSFGNNDLYNREYNRY